MSALDDDTEYRLLADAVAEALNPPDEDVAEVAILTGAIAAVAEFVESLPCACPPNAGPPDWDVAPCGRCVALGRARDERIEW